MVLGGCRSFLFLGTTIGTNVSHSESQLLWVNLHLMGTVYIFV